MMSLDNRKIKNISKMSTKDVPINRMVTDLIIFNVELIDNLKEVKEEIEEEKKKINITNTVGTSVVGVGAVSAVAGIAAAFFTSGLSLVVLGTATIVSTIAGGSVKFGSEVWNYKSKKTFKAKINGLLKEQEKKFNELNERDPDIQELIDNCWNQENKYEDMEETIKFCFRNTGFAISNTRKIWKIFKLIKVLKVSRPPASTFSAFINGFKSTFQLVTNEASSLKSLIGLSTKTSSQTVAKTIAEVASGALVIGLFAWDIYDCVQNWIEDHPLIEVIEKLEIYLKEQNNLLRAYLELRIECEMDGNLNEQSS